MTLPFLAGLLVLSFHPQSGEQTKLPFVLSLLSGLLSVSAIMFAGSCRKKALCSVILLIVVLWTAYRMKVKYSHIKALFRQRAVLTAVEDQSRMAMDMMLLSLTLLAEVSCGVKILEWICFILSFICFAARYWISYDNRTIFLCRSKENTIREIIKGNLRTFPMASDDEDARMSNLYARVNEYMEKSKPFLQEDYDIKNLATAVFSNKTYLSRTINYFSGRNFKQFVNYYRVKYSVSLMEKDPHLKVMELASMSGFHSVVTYNTAFKMFLNDTPASYRQQLKVGINSGLASRGQGTL